MPRDKLAPYFGDILVFRTPIRAFILPPRRMRRHRKQRAALSPDEGSGDDGLPNIRLFSACYRANYFLYLHALCHATAAANYLLRVRQYREYSLPHTLLDILRLRARYAARISSLPFSCHAIYLLSSSPSCCVTP